jgi:hypothetical protein
LPAQAVRRRVRQLRYLLRHLHARAVTPPASKQTRALAIIAH